MPPRHNLPDEEDEHLPRRQWPQTLSQQTFQANRALSSVPQKAFQPSSQGKVDLFSPAKSQSVESQPHGRPQSQTQDHQDHPTAPFTPERPVLTSIPQKMNFTPTLGKRDNSLFGPSPPKAGAKPWQFNNQPPRDRDAATGTRRRDYRIGRNRP